MAQKSEVLETAQGKEILLQRTFDAPVAKVWKAWSEADQVKKWWGPSSYTCPVAKIDFKEGGKYLSCMQSPEGQQFWSTGMYKKIDHLKEIVATDSFSDENGNVISADQVGMPGVWPLELEVRFTFKEDGDQTHFTLHHKGLPEEMAESCMAGWNESFDKLAKIL